MIYGERVCRHHTRSAAVPLPPTNDDSNEQQYLGHNTLSDPNHQIRQIRTRCHLHQVKSLPTVYCNLEEALDLKRASGSFSSTLPISGLDASSVDY